MTTPFPTPIAELPRLFAPPVLAWLVQRGCRRGRWVAPGQDASGEAGQLDFRFDIGSFPDDVVGLRLVFDDASVLTETDKAAISAYLSALGPFLREASPDDEDRRVTLSRALLVDLEHQLRNHLNSMLMTAAALALSSQAQGPLDVYVDQMESDGKDCLALLRCLMDAAV